MPTELRQRLECLGFKKVKARAIDRRSLNNLIVHLLQEYVDKVERQQADEKAAAKQREIDEWTAPLPGAEK